MIRSSALQRAWKEVGWERSKGFLKRVLLGIISAGTANGKVANWKRKKDEKVLEASWKLQAANKVGGDKVLGLSWCPLAPSLAVITDSELVILEEDNIIVRMRNKVIFKSQHNIPNCSIARYQQSRRLPRPSFSWMWPIPSVKSSSWQSVLKASIWAISNLSFGVGKW